MDGLKKFIAGFLVGAVVFSGVGAYASNSKMLEVFYNINDIKINDVSKMPDQAPFTYNETTYVPLRYISEELGLNVLWEGDTKTIRIGGSVGKVEAEKPKGPPTYHPGNGIEYMNYQEGHRRNNFSYTFKANETLADVTGYPYNHYMLSTISWIPNVDNAWNFMEFPLNGEFYNFTAMVGLSENSKEMDTRVKVEIFLDKNDVKEEEKEKDSDETTEEETEKEVKITGERVYSKEIKNGDFPEYINIQTTGAKKMTVKVSRLGETMHDIEVGLFNAQFFK